MRTLILVDLQNDFCPGGTLAVPGADEVIPLINRLMPCFDLIVATQDWHPADHGSFATVHAGKQPGEVIDLDGLQQVLWPVHCVEDTPGAAFPAELNRQAVQRTFRKGTDRRIDSYSGFYDNGHRKATGLGDYLQQRHARDVYVCGLATDYCVKFTALDAVELGLRTHLIEDACRGVNRQPGDVQRAIAQMQSNRVEVVTSAELRQ